MSEYASFEELQADTGLEELEFELKNKPRADGTFPKVKFVVKKEIPYAQIGDAETRAMKVDPVTQKVEFSINDFVISIWSKLVVSTLPADLTPARLKTFGVATTDFILLKLYQYYKKTLPIDTDMIKKK